MNATITNIIYKIYLEFIMLEFIVLALIAFFIFSKLFDSFGKNSKNRDHKDFEDIDPILRRFNQDLMREETARDADIHIVSATEAELPTHIRETFDAIRDLDPQFNLDTFLENAKRAFEMIVSSYAKCDKESLKKLVAPAVLKKFLIDIKQREEKKHIMQNIVVGFNSVEVTDVVKHSSDRFAITLKISTDQINEVKDELGNIIQGHPQNIVKKLDVWTFERNIHAGRSWLLVNTARE